MTKTTHVQARVTPELKHVVITKALWEGISKSVALRGIIAEYGRKHGILEGNGRQQQEKREAELCKGEVA